MTDGIDLVIWLTVFSNYLQVTCAHQQLLASYVCSDVKGKQLNKPTENIWWLWIFRNIEPLAEATTVVTVCY